MIKHPQGCDGIEQLWPAIKDFARAETDHLAGAVIDQLRAYPASGVFGDDVAARHLWDEFCWSLQEGPFDDNYGGLGSLADAFKATAYPHIQFEVENCPRHVLMLMSAHAFEDGNDIVDEEVLGDVWIEGIGALVYDELMTRAGQRSLCLIGPYRSYCIAGAAEGSGMVWNALLNIGVAVDDIVASHCDALIKSEADLSFLAAHMVEAFIAFAGESDEEWAFSGLIEHFGDDVRAFLMEKDVIPALEAMRAALLAQLDG